MTASTEPFDYLPVTIETAPLGHPFTDWDLKCQCRAIVGGIAWPGKRPGFGAVFALDKQRPADSAKIILLEEVEAWDLGELIRHCMALDLRYKPQRWLGDDSNAAAERLIWENRAPEQQRAFYVLRSLLLDMPQPYPYMLATLKGYLREAGRRLFLKESAVVGYLGEIKPDEIPFLELGDYPAVEAVSFAVCDLAGRRESVIEHGASRPAPPSAMTC